MSPDPISVLMIEDDQDDAFIIDQALSTVGDHAFTLVVFHSLGPALNHLANTGADVVLCDLKLPDAVGTEAPARLRAVNPDIRIIMLSSTRDNDMAQACIESGASEFISRADMTPDLLANSLASAA